MADKRNDQKGAFETVGETVGGIAGRAAGRATDMAMDVASSILGPAAEMLGGWWLNGDRDRVARSFGDREDRACREHFDSTRGPSDSTRDYSEVRPLYQFGYTARHNPDYDQQPFDRVEAELERAWEQAGRERFGEWNGVRDYVGFGYDRAASPDPVD